MQLTGVLEKEGTLNNKDRIVDWAREFYEELYSSERPYTVADHQEWNLQQQKFESFSKHGMFVCDLALANKREKLESLSTRTSIYGSKWNINL